ncbi:MAG: SGNH family hydrolase [Methylocella sp.]
MAKNSGPVDYALRAWLLPKRAAAALAAAGFLLCLAGSQPALAQIDPFGWFEQLFRPNPPPGRAVKPRPEFHRAAPQPYLARPRSSRPAVKAGEKAIAKAPAKPAVPPAYFVAVLGDSLGQMLAQGLSEAFENRPEVAILRKAKENSGLVRDDFFDWTQATRDLLASGEKIDFAVMLIGSNDRQPLRDANGSYEPRSPEWQAAYTQRIETIAAMFRDKKIPLVWVGLPILRSERLSGDALAFNEFYRAYAEKAGATYIDIWEAFADEAGQYSAFGPDINGQTVRLRAGDGVHFTKAGARKLAHFVEPEIRRNLDEVLPNTAPAPNPANVANPEGTEMPANVSALPGTEAPPAPKPVAGPILPLTGPVLAPGGELATRTATTGTANNAARTLIEQTLQQGRPLAPKPGRADDFSWPRN